jgi:WD40 repeat protein
MLDTPYKGLGPYEEADQEIFFGRETQIKSIADHLRAFPLTILYGSSGVGKSSVVRAGVAATIGEQIRYNLNRYKAPLIAVVVFPPVNKFWKDDLCFDNVPLRFWLFLLESDCLAGILFLRKSLDIRLKQQIAADIQAIAPHVQAPDTELPFIETLEEWTKKIGEGKDDGKLLIILDQFEDFWLTYSQQQEENFFAIELARAVNRFGLRVNFLLSIRSSAFTQLDRFKSLIPNLMDKRIELKRIEREAAKEAIIKPLLKIYNDQHPEQRIESEDEEKIEEKLIEKSLVEEVLDKVTVQGTSEIEAPYLQLVMKRLWDEERAHDSLKLQKQTLTSLGGTRGIVEEHFKQQMKRLDDEERKIARRILNYLVTPSGGMIIQKAEDLTDYINEDLAVEQKKLPEDKVEKLLAKLSYGSSRILRACEGDRYEIYFNVLAQVVADWLNTRRQIRQLAREAEKAGQDFAFSQIEALRAVIKAGAALQEIIKKDQDWLEDPGIIPVKKNLQVILEDIREQRGFTHPNNSPIYGASISPDGTLLATAFFDGTVCLWDLEQYQEEPIKKLEDPSESVKSVLNLAFSPNGQQLAIASWDGTVHLWNWEENKLLYPPLGKPGGQAIYMVAFSPDGQQLATASVDEAVYLWDLQESPSELQKISLPNLQPFVHSLNFVSQGRQLVIACWDGSVYLWDCKGDSKGNKLTQLGQPQHQLGQPQLLATGSKYGIVSLWDLANPSEVKDKFKAHDATICHASYDAFRDEIDTVAWDGKVRRWHHLKDETWTWSEFSLNQSPIYRASFSPDRQKLVTAATDGAAHLWDLSDDHSSKPGNEQIVVCQGHQGWVLCVSFSPDGKKLATASADRTVRLWDCQDKQIVEEIRFKSTVGRVNFSPNGRYLGIALADPTAYLWDLDRNEKIEYKKREGIVYCLSFNSKSDQIASASGDGTVCLWDLQGNQIGETLSPQSGSIYYVSFSPNNQKLAMACVNGKVLIWDLQSKEKVQCIGHASAVYYLSFSPDGKLLASASADGTARLWDLEGNQRDRFRHQNVVYGVSFSPDGKLLATASGDGKVYLWQVKDGQKIAEFKRHKGQVFSVCFNPNHDGQQVATASEDGTVQLRRIETLEELLKRGRDWLKKS